MNRQKIIFYLPLLIGLAFAFGLHGLRTYIDAQDVTWASTVNIPENFKKDAEFEKLRKQILNRPMYLDSDCYYWVLYASEMARDGKWRIRYNQYDNVPYGREVHWNSGYSWFLIGLGKIDSLITGRNIVDGIEHAARLSNPILFGLFALFWAVVLGMRFNPLIGGIFPSLILFLWSLQVSAGYAEVDHHTLHNMLFLSQLLAVIVGGAGFVNRTVPGRTGKGIKCNALQTPCFPEARKWFVVAGLFGAMGLWVGATQQSVLIGCIGVGGTLALLFVGRTTPVEQGYQLQIAPELWRWWGFSGAIFSLVFYLIEYFPGHMGMRLEVNHPLYALAWAGGAEAIFRIARLRQDNLSLREKSIQYRFLMLALFGIALLPLAVLFGPDQWHTIHDPIMRRVHDNIVEFLHPFNPRMHFGIKKILVDFGLFPLSWLSAVLLLWPGVTTKYQRVLIIQVLFPSLALFGFYLLQNRWVCLLAACLVVLSLVSASALLARFTQGRYRCVLAAGILFFFLVPGNYFFYKDNYCGTRADQVNCRLGPLNNALLAKEVAINLLDRTGEQEVRLISNSSFAPFLAYYGVGRSVSSLYWPNREGIRDYARFFADFGEREAMEIVRERGLTFLLFKMDKTGIARRATWALYGLDDKETIERTLAYRLAKNPTKPPCWLEPFPMFYSPRCQKNGNILYRIKIDREGSSVDP